MRPKRFSAGDVVELRPPDEILATLDDEGRLDGLPFMPEMLAYYGGRHRVRARLERACDTFNGGMRRVPDAVILDELRCDGFAHGGCQAMCRLYWKEAWLRTPADDSEARELSNADLHELTRRISRVVTSVDGDLPVYRCQATTLLEASIPVTRRETPRAFIEELLSRNVTPGRFVRTVARTFGESLARRLHLMSRGFFMPYDAAKRTRGGSAPELKPGQLVRIRSKEEIARTLGPDGKHKGLWFDREMLPFCGRMSRVLQKVERIIDERTGKMLEMRSGCYILEGVMCSGDRSNARRLCSRAIYPYWRSDWLEPVTEVGGGQVTPPAATPDGSPAPSSPVAA